MNVKIGYYPLLDMTLALRQGFSVERFKPFNAIQEGMNARLSEQENNEIDRIAQSTSDWLDVIQRMIDLTLTGMVSPEELLIQTKLNPTILFGENADDHMSKFLMNTWYTHCSNEMQKHSNLIRGKMEEIGHAYANGNALDYVLSKSDRIEKRDQNTLIFHIKPDLSVELDEIEEIIIMPSIYSSRNVAFWYSGKTFLFYMAVHGTKVEIDDPSDMLLLRTSALNDKTRLKMLKLLCGSSMSVNDMAERLNVNASTVSRHFKLFKDVAYVDIQSQEGNSIFYNINRNEIEKAMNSIGEYLFK